MDLLQTFSIKDKTYYFKIIKILVFYFNKPREPFLCSTVTI